MRIAVWHNLPTGGGQRALYDHVRGLIARGHDVEIWAPPATTTPLVDLGAVAPCHEVELRTSHQRYGDYLPYGRGMGLAAHLRMMDHHSARVAEEVNAGRFEVLLSGTCAWFGAPRIGRWSKLPSVLYLQEPHRRLYEAPNAWALPERERGLRGVARSAYDVARVQRMRRQVREEIGNAEHLTPFWSIRTSPRSRWRGRMV